jgi:hypothetical protein
MFGTPPGVPAKLLTMRLGDIPSYKKLPTSTYHSTREGSGHE